MTKAQFVDTNIFLRYLTADPERYNACLALFQQAERNHVHLITSEAVIVEIVYVLSSPKHYQLSRQQIRVALSRLLLLPGLKIVNRHTHLRALALYVQHVDLDFEDCLSVAHMEQLAVQQIYSYDKGFDRATHSLRDRIDHVERLEPTLQKEGDGGVVQSKQQVTVSEHKSDE